MSICNDSIREEFCCPVCCEFMEPPIWECLRGHGFCQNCQRKLDVCPFCRSEIKFQTNETLEKVYEIVEFPCEYQNLGCKFFGRASILRKHQYKCPFAPKWLWLLTVFRYGCLMVAASLYIYFTYLYLPK